MSAPYIIPYNHQPVNKGAGSTSYTVPSGKYARIQISIHTSAYVTCSSATQNMTACQNGSDSITGEFWLMTGDVVTVSNTAASASVSPTSGTSVFLRGSSLSTALINGTAVMNSESFGLLTLSSSITGVALGISGNASVNYWYEEYNVIS